MLNCGIFALSEMIKKEASLSTEIGGYFGLDLPYYCDPFPNAYKFQSGRAALRAVLEWSGIKQVWLPEYICDSVFQAIEDSGAAAKTYRLDDSLYPKGLTPLSLNAGVILYVNYFGLCQDNVNRLLKKIPNKHLVIDNSQALFEKHSDALATIYSARKFVGVPDGGFLMVSGLEIEEPLIEDRDSIDRMKHLLLRMAYSASEGYEDFIKSENSLGNTTPLSMSWLTKRLLAGIDMQQVIRRRRENFLQLAALLDKYNIRKWFLNSETVPLCYPLMVDYKVDNIRYNLRNENIFIPTYWPNLKIQAADNGIEYKMIHNCLAIPCDQRYSTIQMAEIANKIIYRLHNK